MSPHSALHSNGTRVARPAGEHGRYAVLDATRQSAHNGRHRDYSGTGSPILLAL